MQSNRRVIDSLQTANARANHHARAVLRLFAKLARGPTRIKQRLVSGGDGIKDKIIDAFGIARAHDVVWIKRVRAVRKFGFARDLGRDLASNVRDIKACDLAGAGTPRKDVGPSGLDPASDWCDQA
jgi:hypothetical protein